MPRAVPGEVNLWANLTGGQAIDILGNLRGDVNRRRRDQLLQLFDLDPAKKARAYSQGNRQKVSLVSALASDAELLVLDEPTMGFDPLMEAAFRTCILEARAQGRSVLLASHSFAEAESLCDTVTIIQRGRTVESGRLVGLPRLHHTAISVILDDPENPGVHAGSERPRRRRPTRHADRGRCRPGCGPGRSGALEAAQARRHPTVARGAFP
ncbi:ATP-binding cassette domain-containing protein [Paeniglutamicibacter kerguelensis]|uniref:ABC-type multidrug transport system ATPase subunit n=1 Tax=Paeniglutamicibacter kerguelensis TaxID=254788 RepID=A0ABS4XCH6_9MICC|nr:ABC transporter ATP-binding protein [Paeniglutamicibacter kerguelensis]MBP2386170.1 ABC-type multidrug transport system ATPase subunit [Paeniglutamicibacter kerguelensis]